MEECRSHILFIPGIFIEDCPDDENDLNIKAKLDFSSIHPENIDLIEDEEENEITDNEESDENEDDLDDELDNVPSKNTMELDITKKKGLELNELLEGNYEENKNFMLSNQYSNQYSTQHPILYDSIPKYFTDAKSWIKNTNLLCCYCHNNIRQMPQPIALEKNKILVPENEDHNETFVSLAVSKSESTEISEHVDKSADDHLLFSNQTLKEIKAYKLHHVLGCDIVCIVNYIRKINDPRITNKRESMQMSISIYETLTGIRIEDVPDKDLWIVMEQYSGPTGQKRNDYIEKNLNKEIKLKLAMKINYEN
jgi:hypothetical protein